MTVTLFCFQRQVGTTDRRLGSVQDGQIATADRCCRELRAGVRVPTERYVCMKQVAPSPSPTRLAEQARKSISGGGWQRWEEVGKDWRGNCSWFTTHFDQKSLIFTFQMINDIFKLIIPQVCCPLHVFFSREELLKLKTSTSYSTGLHLKYYESFLNCLSIRKCMAIALVKTIDSVELRCKKWSTLHQGRYQGHGQLETLDYGMYGVCKGWVSPTCTEGFFSHISRFSMLVVKVSSPHGNGINVYCTMGTSVSTRVKNYKLQMGFPSRTFFKPEKGWKSKK